MERLAKIASAVENVTVVDGTRLTPHFPDFYSDQYLHPNDLTDPNFGAALREAAANGVQVLAMDCAVTEDSMVMGTEVPVVL